MTHVHHALSMDPPDRRGTDSPALGGPASRECDRAEGLLAEAAATLNEELGIVGLHLELRRVAGDEDDPGPRMYQLWCSGEAAPRPRRDAILVIGPEGVHVMVNDHWTRGVPSSPLSAVSAVVISDLLITALADLAGR
jgi:hypothetical protein